MKLDELPQIATVSILKYLEPAYLVYIQRSSKRLYEAVSETQLLENFRYFTDGYRETERLYRLFDSFHSSRSKFVFGVLYLAFSANYKYKFNNKQKCAVST